MKYQIIGKNIDVTEGIKAALEKKLARMDKYFVINDDVACRAVVRTYRGGGQKVEVTIHTKLMDFRAEASEIDLYAAFDLAIDKLEGQMRKLKTRLDRNKGQNGLGKSVALENFEADESANDEIIRTKSYMLEPMSVEEAITRMEALGHAFFMYLDSDDDMISVLYKRNDGGFGIIQAENKIA